MLTACAPTPGPTPSQTVVAAVPVCRTADGNKVSDQLSRIASEWDDAVKLASSTSRIALSSPVSQLQRIRRDLQAQSWPDCATNAKSLLMRSMDSTINGFLAFMQQRPESVSSADLSSGRQLMDEFSQELLYISGTPRPTPVPPTPTLPPSPRAAIGKFEVLRSAQPDDEKAVVAGSNAGTLVNFVKRRTAGDLDVATVQRMASADLIWRVDAGDVVRILDARPTEIGVVYQVELLTGSSKTPNSGSRRPPSLPCLNE